MESVRRNAKADIMCVARIWVYCGGGGSQVLPAVQVACRGPYETCD